VVGILDRPINFGKLAKAIAEFKGKHTTNLQIPLCFMPAQDQTDFSILTLALMMTQERFLPSQQEQTALLL
jgi:hypothetical protein